MGLPQTTRAQAQPCKFEGPNEKNIEPLHAPKMVELRLKVGPRYLKIGFQLPSPNLNF
jgi:hypothetical protein